MAHVGSLTACGATITAGSPDTFVGDAGASGVSNISRKLLQEKTFVEFQLLNDREEPIPNESYELTLPDGAVITGVLDENGFVHVPNVPRGSCSIKFPKLEDTEHL